MLTALGLCFTAAARATTTIDDQTFFKGVRLGKTLTEVEAYYKPYRHNVGEMWHSGALTEEKDFDLRTASVPQRRIYFSVRASDNRVVSVNYWKLGDNETFSKEEVAGLAALNHLPSGKLYQKLTAEPGDGAELLFCSEAEHAKQVQEGN
jgi:hypothetical protein